MSFLSPNESRETTHGTLLDNRMTMSFLGKRTDSMPKGALPMRKIGEVLRLRSDLGLLQQSPPFVPSAKRAFIATLFGPLERGWELRPCS